MIAADDYAKLARNLAGQLMQEPRIRCALGRAYYAVYHYCQECANVHCGQLTTQEAEHQTSHTKLYLRLSNHSKTPTLDVKLRTIAEDAKKLRDLRVRSDYHLMDDTLTSRDLTYGLQLLTNIESEYRSIFPLP